MSSVGAIIRFTTRDTFCLEVHVVGSLAYVNLNWIHGGNNRDSISSRSLMQCCSVSV